MKRPPRDATTDVLVGLRRVVRFLRLADRDVEAACGLSAAQLFVLHNLRGAPGLSLAQLAKRTLTDQSSVSTVVARLVQRGLVKRAPSREDRRRAELRLTAAGEKTLARAPRVPQAQMIDAISALPRARQVSLARALEELVRAIGAAGVAPRLLFEDERA